MSNRTIKVDTNTKVTIDDKPVAIVKPIITDVKQNITNRVTVSPRTYNIISTDIYTIKRNSELSPWFKNQIDNVINGSSLATNLSTLANQFDYFKDGVTMEIGYLKDKDKELAYSISTLKASNDSNTATIQNLNVTKVTADEASVISTNTIAAWQDGAGSAWFDSKVSTVSNVAYSAAKSASNLTATMQSQQKQLENIYGDLNVLKSQVDGKVETWFGHQDVVDSNGDLIESAEPYASWKAANDIERHTGDTFVKTETDPITDEENIIASWTFVKDATDNNFKWLLRTDDTANKALEAAANAQYTADGKINTFYQDHEPDKVTNPTLGEGDLWLDSDDNNKMYRYQGSPLKWEPVRDTDITASVTRLDEATVSVDGKARAKSSLSVDANGAIAGFVAESDGTTSQFKIYADKFAIANSEGSDIGNPFTIENGKIRLNGLVKFENLDGNTDLVKNSDLVDGATVISGDNILTGYIKAERIMTNNLSSISANLGTVNAGVLYNVGGNSSSYSMKIDLNNGEIHIK